MRLLSNLLRAVSLSALLCGSGLLAAHGQTFAAGTGVKPELGGNIPAHVPSALPPHHKPTDAPVIYARVRNGMLAVDGMVGRVRLNYDVKSANYLYVFVPGVGTELVTLAPTPDSLWTISTYQNGELTMKAGDHVINLTGVESLVNDKGKQPVHLYARLDRDSWKLSHTPMMGFGKSAAAPYEWPGALQGQPASAAPAQLPHSFAPTMHLSAISYQLPSRR